MLYTPLINLSDEELLTHVACKSNPSDEELELAHRLEQLLYALSDMTAAPKRPNLRENRDGTDA